MTPPNAMVIPLELRAERVWKVLSEPERLWSAFAAADRTWVPVDGVMGATLTARAGDETSWRTGGMTPWRYHFRVLDRDDDNRIVHLDIQARPAHGVGAARVIAEVRVRPVDRQSTLAVTWQGTASGEITVESGEFTEAVRAEAARIVRRAAREATGRFDLLDWSALSGTVRRRCDLMASVGAALAFGAGLALLLRRRRLRSVKGIHR